MSSGNVTDDTSGPGARGAFSSSPAKSDGVHPSSDSFGEPLHSRGSVKFRYGAKARHKLSQSPQRPSFKAKRTPKPPKFVVNPMPKVAPQKSRTKPLPPPPPLPVPALSLGLRIGRGTKRQRTTSLSDLTSLSSLSSLSRSASPLPLPPAMSQKVTFIGSDTSTLPDLSPSGITPRKLSRPAQINDEEASPSSRGKMDKGEVWSVHKLGDFVWVLVDKDGVLADDQTQARHLDRMWWPSKILPQKIGGALRVSLFGEVKSGCRTTLEIKSPSHRNILSMATPRGVIRFTPHTFHISPSSSPPSHDAHVTTRKRQKTNLAHKWEMASQKMLDEEEDENDGLPNLLSSFDGNFSAKKQVKKKDVVRKDMKGKGKVKVEKSLDYDVEMDVDTDRWSPPPCDPTLEIPGELLLARAPRSTKYWPAKLIGYVPPTKPTHKPKFTVRFLDDLVFNLTRDHFYTSEEPGFVSCELGQFESEIKDVNDDGESGADSDSELSSAHPRPPSPVPASPPPDADTFSSLSVHAQLAYVKPVLVALLNSAYAPAMKRHLQFLKGGAARESVQEGAAVRGRMDPADVRELQKCLCEWALREEKRARIMVDVGEGEVASEGMNKGDNEVGIDMSILDTGGEAGKVTQGDTNWYDKRSVVEVEITASGVEAITQATGPPPGPAYNGDTVREVVRGYGAESAMNSGGSQDVVEDQAQANNAVTETATATQGDTSGHDRRSLVEGNAEMNGSGTETITRPTVSPPCPTKPAQNRQTGGEAVHGADDAINHGNGHKMTNDIGIETMMQSGINGHDNHSLVEGNVKMHGSDAAEPAQNGDYGGEVGGGDSGAEDTGQGEVIVQESIQADAVAKERTTQGGIDGHAKRPIVEEYVDMNGSGAETTAQPTSPRPGPTEPAQNRDSVTERAHNQLQPSKSIPIASLGTSESIEPGPLNHTAASTTAVIPCDESGKLDATLNDNCHESLQSRSGGETKENASAEPMSMDVDDEWSKPHEEPLSVNVGEAQKPTEHVSASQSSGASPKPVIFTAEKHDISRNHEDIHHGTTSDAKTELDLMSLAPSRQRGCDAYEALSGVEKLSYCTNVLLPEAVQQILLWRAGERTSVELMEEEEENRLHDVAVAMANETDWVFGVIRLREAQTRLQNALSASKAYKATMSPLMTGGTRSRPKRSTVSHR